MLRHKGLCERNGERNDIEISSISDRCYESYDITVSFQRGKFMRENVRSDKKQFKFARKKKEKQRNKRFFFFALSLIYVFSIELGLSVCNPNMENDLSIKPPPNASIDFQPPSLSSSIQVTIKSLLFF